MCEGSLATYGSCGSEVSSALISKAGAVLPMACFSSAWSGELIFVLLVSYVGKSSSFAASAVQSSRLKSKKCFSSCSSAVSVAEAVPASLATELMSLVWNISTIASLLLSTILSLTTQS